MSSQKIVEDLKKRAAGVSDDTEPLVNAIVRRMRAVMAPRGSGPRIIPESPFDLLREGADLIEKLADALAATCQEAATQSARIAEIEAKVRDAL